MDRIRFLAQLKAQMGVHPVVAILGPRQSGKTTLAKKYAEQYSGSIHQFDLENPEDAFALQNPMRALEQLQGLVVIDEIQKLPNLFPILRVLVDRHTPTQYLILGSASRDLIQQSSETLAGRIGYIELTPFLLKEGCDSQKLLLRGGFPLSYLAHSDVDSIIWREAYIQTFLERDIPQLGFNIPSLMLRRFWMMLTHVHGQLLNQSQLGVSMGLSGHTIRRYLDILAGTFMIRIMPPWYHNIEKRQIKTPKLYFRDTGILLSLLNIKTHDELLRNPALGAVWEGFALEQIIQSLNIRPEEAFFWRTQHGAELDLLVFRQGEKIGFEFKFGDTPKITKSMRSALADLELKHLYIVYPGNRKIFFTDKITAVSLVEMMNYFDI